LKITWIGLACFLLVTDDGTRIVIDPFEPHFYGRDYGTIEETADIATVSHNHRDHSFVSILKGSPSIFAKAGKFSSDNISIQGIRSFHDKAKGWERGDNIIFCYDVDGIRVCHLGDLGHQLSSGQLGAIDHVDILILPVGGRSTLDPDEGKAVIAQLKPAIAIPMHFNTGRLTLPCQTAHVLTAWPDIEQAGSAEIEVTKEQLPQPTKVILLDEAI
jgi:L-ascorbate metabolism protein UlaG (beta-lactamase superfamily)